MVSHRAINDIMQTAKKEVHFCFFSVCCIDKKQKSCVKRIHLVTGDGLYDRKAFYKVKIVFYSSYMNDGEFINHNARIRKSFLKKQRIKTIIQQHFRSAVTDGFSNG